MKIFFYFKSIFEHHQLLFSFHITTKILDSQKRLNHDDYQFFVQVKRSTIDRDYQLSNPFSHWLDNNRWDSISELIVKPEYRFLSDTFDQYPKDWRDW